MISLSNKVLLLLRLILNYDALNMASLIFFPPTSNQRKEGCKQYYKLPDK